MAGAYLPAPPAPDVDPWWHNEKMVLKVTAAIGALITISGVALLVAFAIQNGLLGPLGRVILAYCLATGLAVTAVVVHRKDPANAGVAAAAAAAAITSHITTSVLVHGLGWWPNWLGTIAVLAVAGLGFFAARQWKSPALITAGLIAAFIAAGITAWPRSGDPEFVTAAVLLPSLMAIWIWRGCPGRIPVTVTAAVLYLVGGIIALFSTEPGWLSIVTFIVVGAAMILAEFLSPVPEAPAAHSTATPIGTSAPAPPTAGHADSSPDTTTEGATPDTTTEGSTPDTTREGSTPAPTAGSLRAPTADDPLALPVPAPPTLTLPTLNLLAWTMAPLLSAFGPGDNRSAFIALVLGFAIGGAGFGPWLPSTDPRMSALRWAGLMSAAWPALELGATNVHAPWPRIPALLVAAAFVWLYIARPTRLGRVLVPLWTAVALACNTPALILTMFAPSYLIEANFYPSFAAVPDATVPALLIGVIALGLIAVLVAGKDHAGTFEKAAALVGLLLTAVPVINLLTAAGMRFSLAHVIVSIGWMAAAAWLMLAPRHLNAGTNLAASLVIAGVATLKLVFYDMQAMSGLTRVSAFLLCGLVMLGMVVARSLRDRKHGPTAAGPEASRDQANPGSPGTPRATTGV